MRFLFYTSEGYTLEPHASSIDEDLGNKQILGFAEGTDEEEALGNLLKESPKLKSLYFNKVECIKVEGKKKELEIEDFL